MRTTKWKEGIQATVACSITAAAAVVCVLLCFVNLTIFSVFASVAFALLFMYDKAWRPFAMGTGVLCCAISAVIDLTLLPVCAVCIAVGGAVAWFYCSGRPKFDAALVVVGLYLLMFACIFWIQAALETSDASLSAVLSYYAEQISLMKQNFTAQLVEVLSQGTTLPEKELTQTLTMVLDAVMAHIPSILASLCLGMAGLMFKLLSFVTVRVDADHGAQMRRFSFATPVIFAYFYAAVFLVSLFAGTESVFALCVGNLQLFFMCMYAYVGIKYLRFLARRTCRRHPMTFFILIMVFILPSLAVQLLAFEGVVAVITANRMQKQRRGNDDVES